MPARTTLVLLVGVVSCWADFPDDRLRREASVDRSIPPDQPKVDLLKCTPNALLACTSDKRGIIACKDTGYGTVTAVCSPYQCTDPEHVCNGCKPGTPPTCGTGGLVTCSSIGVPTTTPCPKGCSAGACL